MHRNPWKQFIEEFLKVAEGQPVRKAHYPLLCTSVGKGDVQGLALVCLADGCPYTHSVHRATATDFRSNVEPESLVSIAWEQSQAFN